MWFEQCFVACLFGPHVGHRIGRVVQLLRLSRSSKCAWIRRSSGRRRTVSAISACLGKRTNQRLDRSRRWRVAVQPSAQEFLLASNDDVGERCSGYCRSLAAHMNSSHCIAGLIPEDAAAPEFSATSKHRVSPRRDPMHYIPRNNTIP